MKQDTPARRPLERAYVIGNPKAGTGGVREGWRQLMEAISAKGLQPEPKLTDAPGHAASLAAEARHAGVELVVAVGGDGTIHEVVNGLLQEGPGEGIPALGIVPLGSGSDYAKTFEIPQDPLDAVGKLAGEERAVDAGEVSFDGGRRYFVNIAEVGIGAETVRRASRLPRRLGGATYGLAFLATLPAFRRPRADVRMTDAGRFTGRITNLVVAVARYFGGGMHVAPGADPADGLFDVQIQKGSKVSYVRSLPKVYKGSHLPHPDVSEYRAQELEVRCDPQAAIEADGEVLGTTPATFRCLRGALRLRA